MRLSDTCIKCITLSDCLMAQLLGVAETETPQTIMIFLIIQHNFFIPFKILLYDDTVVLRHCETNS